VLIRVRLRWPFTFGYVGLGVGALVAYRFTPVGVGIATLALVSIIVVHRMRLTADASGVTVVNLGRPQHIDWGDISDFRRGRIAVSTCLDICGRDLSRVHAWAVTATTAGAYSEAELFEITVGLRRMLVQATGEIDEDVMKRAIEDGLAAARDGHFREASDLVTEQRVDAAWMAQQLIDQARQS